MNCQRLVLVGDAHLGRGSPEAEQAFLAFLETVPDLGDRLVVTGDLFEFWFSYHRAAPGVTWRWWPVWPCSGGGSRS